MNHKKTCVIVAVVLLAGGFARGAEVRLKAQARCSTGVVRLGDVADIHAVEDWQREQLAAIELGPAPATGGRRFIRAREVQDALWMRGVNVALHQISGSDRIEVIGPGEPVVAEKPQQRLDDASRDRAQRLVAEAIVQCLNGQTAGRKPWDVTVRLSDDQVAGVMSSARRVVAEGGTAPWTGKQRFTMTIEGTARVQQLTVDADVALPPAVVAVTRNLSAGTVLHESDLILKPVAAVNDGLQPFYRIEDVVGQETAFSLPGGAILGRSSIRRPVVVRRGDAVTLYAHSAGLRVRTTVRAREDGGLNDLIAVESLSNREAFYARVTGIQEAEVFAAPAEASSRAATPEPSFGNRFDAQGVVR